MDLIYYRGLNCHLACVVNIAALLGVNYTDAFSALWSETDFTDEVKYNIYVSKRVFTGLKAIGVITAMRESISPVSDGDMFFVGIDTFYIPWHPVFKNFHDSHYFFARKESQNSILCFDPIYNEKNIKIKLNDILPFAFELGHVYKLDVNPPKTDVLREARDVLRRHPETAQKLSAEILKCENDGSRIMILLKQITAMINNRYLFRHFFHNYALISGRHKSFFDDDYFLKWEAVRNGLYKATIVRENKSVVGEVFALFSDLMQEEINMAKAIIATEGS